MTVLWGDISNDKVSSAMPVSSIRAFSNYHVLSHTGVNVYTLEFGKLLINSNSCRYSLYSLRAPKRLPLAFAMLNAIQLSLPCAVFCGNTCCIYDIIVGSVKSLGGIYQQAHFAVKSAQRINGENILLMNKWPSFESLRPDWERSI